MTMGRAAAHQNRLGESRGEEVKEREVFVGEWVSWLACQSHKTVFTLTTSKPRSRTFESNAPHPF